jgi:hypothetical protein
MTIEFDDKGKFFTDVITKVTVPAHPDRHLAHSRPP